MPTTVDPAGTGLPCDCASCVMIAGLSRVGPVAAVTAVAMVSGISASSHATRRAFSVTMAYVRVQCYSGAKANERPVRFELDGREYIVEDILDRWYGPNDTFFKLLADDKNIYILRYNPATDKWSLESFRKT